MNPNLNFLNNSMINNYNNINNMMLNLPNDNMNPNVKQQILNLINQNIQMTEQISMNNKMIKSMIENADFENDNNEENKLKDFCRIDFFPGNYGQKINVVFEDNRGSKINMITPLDVKMKDLLSAFHIKLQIFDKYIYKTKNYQLSDYSFIYRALKISLNEEKTLLEFGLNNPTEYITFFRNNVLIGG